MSWVQDAGAALTGLPVFLGCLVVTHAVTGAVCWLLGRRWQSRWFVRTALDEVVVERVAVLLPEQREPS